MKMVNGIPKWKHNNFHEAVQKKAGKANRCDGGNCTSVNPKRFEWALKKGCEYSENPEDYIQMCTSCHRKYDFNEEIRAKLKSKKQGENNNRAKLTISDVSHIYGLFSIGVTGKAISEMYQVAPSTISDIKTGKRWPEFYKKHYTLIKKQ